MSQANDLRKVARLYGNLASQALVLLQKEAEAGNRVLMDGSGVSLDFIQEEVEMASKRNLNMVPPSLSVLEVHLRTTDVVRPILSAKQIRKVEGVGVSESAPEPATAGV